MQFTSFLRALESDIVQTKAITYEKCTDINNRPVIQLRNLHGDLMLEILYSQGGYKAKRAIKFYYFGSYSLVCASSEQMAKQILYYLRGYELPKATQCYADRE